MIFGGFQKTTTIDFPGRLSALVFTGGCNFHCPYCHNPQLVSGTGETISEAAVIDHLKHRRPLLDGLVISGGEPTLQPDLASFCAAVKSLGYAVKLDTNGSRPEMLAALLPDGLIDYVALDLKSDPWAYPPAITEVSNGFKVLESLEILKTSGVSYELRTTVAAPLVNRAVFEKIIKAARGPAPLYLQPVRLTSALLRPELLSPPEDQPTAALLSLWAEEARAGGVPECRPR